MSPDGLLPEIVESPIIPWFIGVQYPPRAEVDPAVRAASAAFRHPLVLSFIEDDDVGLERV
jgi:CTP synthase (UTP-ammonia lyase)